MSPAAGLAPPGQLTVDDAVMLAFERAADTLHPLPSPHYNDPVKWIREFIDFPTVNGKSSTPTDYQDDILSHLIPERRVSVRGPHGLGKTAIMSWATIWFACTREMAQQDWKVPTLASVWRQLDKFLWPEIHKWVRCVNWDKLGIEPWRPGREMQELNLKLKYGAAFALASDVPESLEGAHADHILYVFDEAKAIPGGIFDAAEGAFSGSGADTALEAIALAFSTPGEPAGRFAEIQKRQAGTEDWWVRHVTLKEAIKAGRISREWADARKRQWGETSAVYQNRVLGEFATQDELGVVPLGWIEEAQKRWQEFNDARAAALKRNESDPIPLLTRVGVDVARSGTDDTVLVPRFGKYVAELQRESLNTTTATTGIVAGKLRAHGVGSAVVDVIGIGAGVVDQLREQGFDVDAFNASEPSYLMDVTGELGFVNRRSAAWWTLREFLDPVNGMNIMLPPDDMLVGDLTAPRWKVTSGGKIQIESKEEIKKRLGRSTDSGDAVVMSLAPPEPEDHVDIVGYEDRVTIGPPT